MIEKFQISFSLAYQKFALCSSISRWLFRQFLLIRRVSKTWYIFSACVVDSVYDCIDNKFQVSFRFRKCRTFTVVKVNDRRDKFSLTRISTADTCLPRSHRLSQCDCIDRKFQISLGLNFGTIFVSCSREQVDDCSDNFTLTRCIYVDDWYLSSACVIDSLRDLRVRNISNLI